MNICNSAMVAVLLLMPLSAGGATAKEQLDEQVAAYKKAGQPIEPQDFNRPKIADGDNGAINLRAAAGLIDTKSDLWKTVMDGKEKDTLPLADADVEGIRAVVAANEKAFAHVDAAMQKKDIDWGIEIKSPTIEILLPDLSLQRALARLIAARALVAHQSGDDATALSDVRRLLFIADAAGRMPFIVSNVVARSIRLIAARTGELVAPELKVGSRQGQATAEQLRQTIGALLDDAKAHESLRTALLAERASQLDLSLLLAEKKLDAKHIGNVKQQDLSAITPEMAYGDALLLLRRTTGVIEAVSSAQTWPAANEKLPPLPAEIEPPQRRNHIVLNLLLPSLDNVIRGHYRVRTQRRMVATALAIRWYAADHQGANPAALKDLVPKYLPAVPTDAIAPGAPPIGYLSGGSAPVLFSAADKTLIVHLTRPPRKNTPAKKTP
jgi:hypothetical protein